MKKKNYIIIILNIFTLFFIIGGSSMASNSKSTQGVIGTYHGSFSSSLSTMNLNMKAAVITISYENNSNASITSTLLQNNVTSGSTKTNNPYPPSIISDDSTLTISSTYPNNQGYSEEINIILPTSARFTFIHVQNLAGNIFLNGVNINLKKIFLNSNAGNISFQNNGNSTQRNVTLQSDAGNINILGSTINTTISAMSQAGNINYQGYGSSIKSITSAGNITLKTNFTSIYAQSNAGNIFFKQNQEHSPYSLNVPSNFTPQLNFKSNAGNISCVQ